MDACDNSLLGAFVDGELELPVHQRVAAHVAQCPACAAEVQSLRELSAAFIDYPFKDLTARECVNLHEQLEQRIDAPLWRLGGVVGLIAASILVVAATWLAALPERKPGIPANAVMASAPDSWDQIAVSMRVPMPGAVDDKVYLADSHLDEWMLQGLNRSQP